MTLRPDVRRGLTLMELIVVLVILVAIAGIVIPLLPAMLGRAETATGATSQLEIAKAVQMFEQTHGAYPRDWDSLVAGNAVATYVRGGSDLALDAGLDAAEATALTTAGVTRLQKMIAAPTRPTFDPYGDAANPDSITNGLPVAAGTKLVTLTLSGQRKLGLADTTGAATASGGKFVVVGFGRRATILGRGVMNAPVVFRDTISETADQVYCRFGVVFQVSKLVGTTAVPLDRARLVGVCNFKADGITTSDDDVEKFNTLSTLDR